MFTLSLFNYKQHIAKDPSLLTFLCCVSWPYYSVLHNLNYVYLTSISCSFALTICTFRNFQIRSMEKDPCLINKELVEWFCLLNWIQWLMHAGNVIIINLNVIFLSKNAWQRHLTEQRQFTGIDVNWSHRYIRWSLLYYLIKNHILQIITCN